MNLLDAMVRHKRAEVAAGTRLLAVPPSPHRDFAAVLRQPGLSVIAEVKRRSPSKGLLRADLDPGRLAAQYARGGATAISCLTDAEFFGALPDDLARVRAATDLPILRKDFIVDERQVAESHRAGADAILLIARILDCKQLADFLRLGHDLGLAVLVEVHDEAELDRALSAGGEIVGINNRDLDTFAVSLETSFRLRPRVPAGRTAVAESGIRDRADVAALEQAGFDAILVGESLVTADDPAAALAGLRGEA
jgi:indole-3-glycerol phosphate synthase